MKNFAKTLNKKLYYGWMIVFMSALALMFSAPGQTYSISIFIDVFEHELGFSKAALSTGYSIATITSGSLLIFIGKATDRFGQRSMMMVVGAMLALTTFFNSFVMHLWMAYLGFFLLRYFGQGSLTLIPNSLVPQWFEKKRATALSVAAIGNLIATMFVPAFNIWLIDRFEWQNAWRFWGIALLVVFVPMVILFVINRPEDINIPLENNGEDDANASRLRMEASSWSLKEALTTKAFWIVGLIGLIIPMFTTGITFHWIAMMAERQVSRMQAGISIGLIALPFAVTPLIARAFLEKAPPNVVFMITLIMTLISMIALSFWVQTFPRVIIFILFYGLAASIQAIALNTLYPDFFGRKYLGSIRGAATVFMVIGSALGPLPFGVVHDRTGSFNPALYGMMVMTIIAIALAFFIKKPVRSLNHKKDAA